MKIIPSATAGSFVALDISEDKTESRIFLEPDEALALAAGLISASNEANGITPTGIFA